MIASPSLETELAEAETALSRLRAEMDAAADKGGIPHEEAVVFARRMESINDRIACLKKAIRKRDDVGR